MCRLQKYFYTSLMMTVFPFACANAKPNEDPYLWLEEVTGERATKWVTEANADTDESFSDDPLYKQIYTDALDALNRDDKLPEISLRGDSVFSLIKTESNPRGRYQRATLETFKSGNAKWQTVIDIDALGKKENEKWVFHGMDCLAPENIRCLVFLSPGGGDAHEMREFNLESNKFVEDGFYLPTSKMIVNWVDEDHLYVATDFGEDSMTESGYPATVRIWTRGTELAAAKSLMTTGRQSVLISAQRFTSDSRSIDLINETLDYWNHRIFRLKDNKVVLLAVPESAVLTGVVDGELLISLQEDWQIGSRTYVQGSVLLADADALEPTKADADDPSQQERLDRAISVLIAPSDKEIIEDVSSDKKTIFVEVLNEVKSKIYRFEKTATGWNKQTLQLPSNGKLALGAIDETSSSLFVRYEDFLTPPSLYYVSGEEKPSLVMRQEATFDSSNMVAEQYFATSADGTRVPYFVVRNKDMIFNGKNPAHIFAYGGFRASLTPSYSGSYEDLNGIYGKAWLERGGVFVLANIRGGGEYGPQWHARVLKENRHKVFEDFEAVANDLIAKKITSPKHLGIEGRSNGGLLVAVAMQRQPNLYGAIVCGVPLLDMQRYHLLLAGSSWMAEYGNPETEDWQYIKNYSPYQNFKENVDYPAIFFFTSTKDDRVHPGHARKMAAKMKANGNEVEYFENTEGGHKGSVTSDQLAKRVALAYSHLWRQLGPQ